MKALLLLLLLGSASAFAATHQALVVVNGSNATVPTRPNTPLYNASTNFRFVLRVHNCTNQGWIMGGDMLGGFSINTDCNSINFTSGSDGSTAAGATFPSGSSDVVAQVQRINGGQQLCVEVWRTNTGAYNVGCTNPSSPGGAVDLHQANFWLGGGYTNTTDIDIDYVRWFSTVVPLGTIPSANPGGDMADWELDGDGTDSSGQGLNLTLPNGATFVTTSLYGPIVAFPSASNCFINNTSSPWFCVYSIGNPGATPLNTTAYSPNQGDTLTYSWNQVDGPVTGTITNNAASHTTVTNLTTFGQYDFQLTATDTEGEHSSGTITLGMVKVGSSSNNCLVSDVPSNLQYLIGPLTPWGSSCDPWPWYDVAEIANANVLMSEFRIPPSASRAANPGTITVNAGVNPPTITGTGTHFTTDCSATVTLPSGSPSAAPNCNNIEIWIWWNAEGGTGNGRHAVQISVQDDTHATITSEYYYAAPAPYSGLQYSYVDYNDVGVPFAIAQNGVGGSYNWNYYDNVIAFYRLYYRTGLTAYLTYARTLADAWWVYALDHGYNQAPSFPRLLGLPGMMARAIEGGFTSRWAGIENKVQQGPQGVQNPPNTEDVRESGYSESYLALLTVLDPNITGNPTNQSNYCGTLANSVNTFWANAFSQGGGIPMMDFFKINATYPSIGLEVEPLQLVITATGLRDAYRAASSTNCHDSTTAANAINFAKTVANFIYQSGQMGFRSIPAANGGGVGRAGTAFTVGSHFLASGGTATQSCNFLFQGSSAACVPGKVSGTVGSTTLTGVGTTFTHSFHCNGTDGIGIISPPDNANVAQDQGYVVASCASDTQLTLASPLVYAPSSWDIEETQLDTYSGSTCAPMQTAYCYTGTGNTQPSVDYTIDNAGILGWMYQFTGQPVYRSWADDLFGAAYGGPAGGPGTTGPPAGPMASGQTTSAYGYISALPSCNTSAPPCGGVGSVTDATGTHPAHWGKDFGVGSGWSGQADNFFAYRLMVPSSQCVSH
ncbi:MAG: hypothetical protein JO145_14905 [Acidobacteriaceae bacterium]|nr:hypothetical protein [Acidobacteriaceae bacterium]